MFQHPLGIASNAINLKRLIWLRFIILASELAAAFYAIYGLHFSLALKPLFVLFSVAIVINLLTLKRLQQPWPVTDKELFFHFSLDVLLLTVLLYFTGGSTNPFAPLYLIPLTLTAATLPGFYTWCMVLVTVSCYSLLFFMFEPLPDIHGSHDQGFRLHVFGMWLGFLLSAVLISSFGVSMARTVRRQDKNIADLRESQLKQEKIVAMGTLAAGAAHELGSPLSTMAILLKDHEPGTVLEKNTLTTLQQQVQRCRAILGSITATANTTRAESGGAERLRDYLENLIENWKNSRVDISATIQLAGPDPSPRIASEQTLNQSLQNILNNAADASPRDIQIRCEWTQNDLVFEVGDRGKGLALENKNKLGNSIYTSKEDGMGLGLFLTYTTLERFGGQVELLNREGGGVLCRVILPLKLFLV